MTNQECINYLAGENKDLKDQVKKQSLMIERVVDFNNVLQFSLKAAERGKKVKMYAHLYRAKENNQQ